MRYGQEMSPETILVASIRARDPGQLDCLWNRQGPMPTLEAVLEAAEGIQGDLIIGGGEPTLRSDLPALISALGPRAVLATDGLALHRSEVVEGLVSAGLRRVRIGMHSARADAHDWIVGIPGAHRRVRTAIGVLMSHQVDVQVEVVLTRPAAPYLEETVALLLKAGIQHIRFRPIRQVSASDSRFASTAPRFALMQPSLEAALRLALQQGARVDLCDMPTCSIPGFDELHRPAPTWQVPAGVERVTPPGVRPCGCEVAQCCGAPEDYVRLFGWGEFLSEVSGPSRAILPVPHPGSGEDAVPPPARSTLAPATRVSEAVRLSAHSNLGGDPMPEIGRPDIPPVVAIAWSRDEATRSIKQRLVQAAQVGSPTLQLLGDLSHPEAFPLIREALRLSFERVVVTADLSGLESLDDKMLFQLRSLHQIWTSADQRSVDVARRILGVAKVPYTSKVCTEEDLPILPFGPPGTVNTYTAHGEIWPQWAESK
jgi:ABC-type transporter Mla MlaB component